MLALYLTAQKSDTLFVTIDGIKLHTVLTTPATSANVPLAIFIAGSGPTDLDGNNQMMKNNSLRYLSDELVAKNIATLRFDKYGIAKSADPAFDESKLTFDHYVNNVVSLVGQMKAKGFTDIYIVGHSEGSLIGLAAIQKAKVKGFVSVAGAGFPADEILKTQLKPQLPPDMYNQTIGLIDSLKNGNQVTSAPAALYSLFRPSVQPYLISWFKYSPVELMSKVSCPTLIIQGDKDLQITITDAETLAKAAKNGKLVIVKNMNHVLKTVTGDAQENMASYSNPALPVNPELSKAIIDFVLSK
jgi:pimeloyl-ACP methyl ester carboxylesterase